MNRFTTLMDMCALKHFLKTFLAAAKSLRPFKLFAASLKLAIGYRSLAILQAQRGAFVTAHSALILTALLASTAFTHAQNLYTNDFQKAEIGKVPEDLMVLDGLFAVQEEGENKFLELPGTPTDTYTVMFGPVTNVNIAVSARIFSTAKGRRMPAFGVALCGVGGYKLQVSAAKKAIELFKGEQVMKTMEYSWKSGEWSSFHLSAVQTKDGVKVEGTVSQDKGDPIVLTFDDTVLLTAGKASITGTPFAGTAIRFDDLAVSSVK